MDAQQQHDRRMLRRRKLKNGSRARLEDSLANKADDAKLPSVGSEIDQLLAAHPGLTREKLLEMMADLGF